VSEERKLVLVWKRDYVCFVIMIVVEAGWLVVMSALVFL
jgi:hypothetical protein